MTQEKIHANFLRVIYELRGKVLQNCIELEMMMDRYIVQHFCETKTKMNELASLVLVPRVSWSEKFAIFTVLIEKYNQSFIDEYPEFRSDIKNIIEHRNVFAHYPANATPNGIKLFTKEGIVAFLKFKNAKMPVTKEIVYFREPSYTRDEINGILKGIHTYVLAVHKMHKKRRK